MSLFSFSKKSQGAKAFFSFFFKGTWKISFAQMVAIATSVKTGVNLHLLAIMLKIPPEGLEGVYQ